MEEEELSGETGGPVVVRKDMSRVTSQAPGATGTNDRGCREEREREKAQSSDEEQKGEAIRNEDWGRAIRRAAASIKKVGQGCHRQNWHLHQGSVAGLCSLSNIHPSLST